MNKKLLLGLALIFFIGKDLPVSAQIQDVSMLCQGPYYTEAEGKAALAKFANRYDDKKSWEKRAAQIWQGNPEGRNLVLLTYIIVLEIKNPIS